MTLDIRNPAPDELQAVLRTVEAAFGHVPDEQWEPRNLDAARKTMPLDRIAAAFDGGQPVGVAAAWPFTMTVPGGELPCGGITWVSVLPSHRRQGLASQLLRRLLDQLHELGEPLAALWAAEAAIYGRFGFGMAAPLHHLDADKAGFAFRDDPGSAGQVRLVTLEEALELFPPVYEAVRRQRPGMVTRSPAAWREQCLSQRNDEPGSGSRFHAILSLDGAVSAYAVYRFRQAWERELTNSTVEALEVVGLSVAAVREMWRFLFSIDLAVRVTSGNLDPAAPLFLGVADPRRLRLSIVDGLWLRLVDVDAALRARSWATDGQLVIQVRDGFCSWNSGRYRVGPGAGRTNADPDLVLAVEDLAPAYLGGITVGALAAAGRVQELSAGAVGRADALFRTLVPPFCPDRF